MRFLIEPVYCMTWIWTLHRAHNKLKSPIEEDNICAISLFAGTHNNYFPLMLNTVTSVSVFMSSTFKLGDCYKNLKKNERTALG